MTAIKVKDINTNFPEILKKVRLGEEVGILHGNNKIPVAMLVPYLKEKKMNFHNRKFGMDVSKKFESLTEKAVELLYEDYLTDKELTVFTQLDCENFYETR